MEKNTKNIGRFGFIRSSEDVNEMMLGDGAFYDQKNNLWYEHVGHTWDGNEDEETRWGVHGMTLDDFIEEAPRTNCRETWYDFRYGEGFDGYKGGYIEFNTHTALERRVFTLDIEEVTLENVKEYIDAIMYWHITGEFGKDIAYDPRYNTWRETSKIER